MIKTRSTDVAVQPLHFLQPVSYDDPLSEGQGHHVLTFRSINIAPN
jgi:hypothetical protein